MNHTPFTYNTTCITVLYLTKILQSWLTKWCHHINQKLVIIFINGAYDVTEYEANKEFSKLYHRTDHSWAYWGNVLLGTTLRNLAILILPFSLIIQYLKLKVNIKCWVWFKSSPASFQQHRWAKTTEALVLTFTTVSTDHHNYVHEKLTQLHHKNHNIW